MKSQSREVKEEIRTKPILGQSLLILDYIAKTLLALSGSGGGKTILGYWWLWHRMEKYPGYGWGMAEPTYPMLSKIIINSPDPDRPNIIEFFRRVGHAPVYHAVSRILETRFGQIYLGSADNPDSMQGVALRGYWLDEAGMMSYDAYQTALQRVAMLGGQVLLTTTPYNRGWLKSQVWDRADGDMIHAERWKSIDRPGYPVDQYEMMKKLMSTHRFSMMFDARFERPEGLIYGDFKDRCVIPRFNIPEDWPRFVGMDFGGLNTAAIFLAQSPNGNLYAYREYLAGNRTASGHASQLKRLSEGETFRKIVGGSASEGQWRREFTEAGWNITPPIVKDVEVGIDRVVSYHKSDSLFIMDDLIRYLDEKASYSRILDSDMLPTEKIENKEKYHLLDSERYIAGDVSSRRQFAFEV
tara:strand:+ start:429 stop:1664 length:1236 start_codon:yes stop_codon:yes gene_type:complete